MALAGSDSEAMPSLPVIVFIPRSGERSKPNEYDREWLPRSCPACKEGSVIGHGRRLRQAHDGSHTRIRVRRGRCKSCRITLTVLPAWCVPHAPYSLNARQDTIEALAAGTPVDQAAPDCLDPQRTIDPSTIRSWCWRRIESLPFICSPTLLAWDFLAAARMLVAEGSSP